MQLINDHITVQVSALGAELTSLCRNGIEHLWQADPRYWKRHAPILFPIVGKVCGNSYRVDGHAYSLPQHGFARDSQFDVLKQSSDTLVLRLASSAATLANYPYPFVLTASYRLDGATLHCDWQVDNPADAPMYFQIGAHPAFCYPQFDADDPMHGYLRLTRRGEPVGELRVRNLGDSGCVMAGTRAMPLDGGLLSLTQHLFDDGALILEGSQADSVTLMDQHHNPLLQVTFDAPLLGIWSPVNAPFCCIEPWYGRADDEGFAGDISQRPHIQQLAPHGTFTFRYDIALL